MSVTVPNTHRSKCPLKPNYSKAILHNFILNIGIFMHVNGHKMFNGFVVSWNFDEFYNLVIFDVIISSIDLDEFCYGRSLLSSSDEAQPKEKIV